MDTAHDPQSSSQSAVRSVPSEEAPRSPAQDHVRSNENGRIHRGLGLYFDSGYGQQASKHRTLPRPAGNIGLAMRMQVTPWSQGADCPPPLKRRPHWRTV